MIDDFKCISIRIERMKIYLVGGSVRDKLLNIPPRDRDYLVLDASEEELSRRGLVKVGQTFPIFLNPETGEEYSLGKSLVEDLARRDLTINAMAMGENNELIDLYGGESDLRKRILRHVSADNFFHDPLRVLRAARFLAQLPEFSLHPETLKLMREVVITPEYKKIISERIIKELKRVFLCEKPSRFFETLKEVGGFEPFFHEIKCSFSELDELKGDEEHCFSWLVSGLSLIELENFTKRLNVQTHWIESARAWILLSEIHLETPEEILEYFDQTDAFRKPRMIYHVAALNRELGAKLLKALGEIEGIGIADVSPELKGKEISAEIRSLRLAKLRANLSFLPKPTSPNT